MNSIENMYKSMFAYFTFFYFLSVGLASSNILGVALYLRALGLITNASSLKSLSLPAGYILCSASFSIFGVTGK